MNLDRRLSRVTLRCGLAATAAVAMSSAVTAEDDRRWRIFEDGDKVLLSASHTDEPSDDLGSPFFRCERKSGTITIEGTASQELRNAMAGLIRSNGYPQANLIPPSSLGPALLTLSYSEMGGNWQYGFSFLAAEPAFNDFAHTGRLTFKVGSAVVQEEFKVGLDNVAKFQAICKRPN